MSYATIPTIDSHCHLDDPRFSKDLDQILSRARQQGIQQFIVPGVKHQQWPIQLALATQHHGIFNAFGIHPWFCEQHNDTHFQQLRLLLKHAIAVGECGLDFIPKRAPASTQINFFQKHIDLADELHLPMIIHSVKSADQVALQLRPYPELRGVIHGFSGSIQQAERFIQMGFYIGIGTRLLHSHAKKVHALACSLPLSSLLLETDAPDGLGPHQRNEPAQLLHVAQALATLRQQDLNAVLSICAKNTQELFQL